MKKILLVLTGGTIGSSVIGTTIETDTAARHTLMRRLETTYPHCQDFTFKTIQPINFHSENLLPQVWAQIIAAVEAEHWLGFDGIIITHGTDTLAFTAAALGLFWHSLHKPVLLVSSDYPLADSRANGVANFICALEFIRQRQETGVFVPYQNQNQPMQVHLGTRLCSSLPLSNNFFSVQHNSYLTFDGHGFTARSSNTRPQQKQYRLTADFTQHILIVRPYPGLNYDGYNLTGVNAVLHDLYHSGTASVAEDQGGCYALTTFISRCRKKGITVYLAPVHKSQAIYESTQTLLEQGARMLCDMSLEAAYAKLLLAYGNFTDPTLRSDFLDADLAYEQVAP